MLRLLSVLIIFLGIHSSAIGQRETEILKDPVCQMQVTENDLHFKFEDKLYFFCSPICKEQFVANPNKFLKASVSIVCPYEMPNYADSVNLGFVKEDKLKNSPRRIACYQYEDAMLRIDYGSPGVRGRVVWGGLVPYDEVWSAGAHNATKLTLTSDVLINGKQLFGGEYALFVIPHKDEWELVINEDFNQHLADNYDLKKDVLRIKVKPGDNAATVQRLTYTFVGDQNNRKEVILRFQWERTFIEVPIQIE